MKQTLVILFSVLLVFSCSEEDNNPNPGGNNGGGNIPVPTVEPTDPEAVSTEMGVSNPTWTSQSGNIPAASGNVYFRSDDNNDTLFSTNGLTASISLGLDSSTAGSVLFQIEGSASHYEAPADPDGKIGLFPESKNSSYFMPRLVKSSASGSGMSNDSIEYVFLFNIPSSIKPGIFCVNLAVKSISGDYSDTIRVCIQIFQRGGSGTANLTSKTWKASTGEGFENGVPRGTFNYGVNNVSDDTVWCSNPPPDFEIVQTTDFQSLVFEFKNDGSLTMDDVASYEWADGDCGNITINGDSWDEEVVGGWSYNDNTKELILSFSGFYDENGVYYSDSEIIRTTLIENTPTQLVVEILDEDYRELITLIPN